MASSAINGDSANIFPGAAVAGKAARFQFDRVILAGGSVLAGGITSDGAKPKGVVTVWDTGIIDLDNWTMATGAKYLTVGAVYTVSTGGKLVANGSGQVAGLALSKTELRVLIQATTSTGTSASADITATNTADSVAGELAAHIAATVVHGTASNVVGQTDEQTLERKTIGQAQPRNGRFRGLVSANIIAAGEAVTVPTDCNMLIAGPLSVTGSFTCHGYFTVVNVP